MDTLGLPSVSGSFSDVTHMLLAFGTDFFAFIVAAALIALFALVFGSDRFMPLVAGVFSAIPLYLIFPYKDILGDKPDFSVGVFFLLVVKNPPPLGGGVLYYCCVEFCFLKIPTYAMMRRLTIT